jgi:hypothetical protein
VTSSVVPLSVQHSATLRRMADAIPEHPLKQVAELYKEVADKLTELTNGPCGEQADTLLCISAEALRAYAELWKAEEGKNIQYTAFAARNLLELLVWAQYCAVSEENAARFKQDAARDAYGMVAALDKLANHLPSTQVDVSQIIAEAKPSLQRLSAVTGVEETDTQFRSVAEAARQLGTEVAAPYRGLNIILSKFVHPTAMSVIADWPSEIVKNFNRGLLRTGTHLACAIVTTIGETVPRLANGPDYRSPQHRTVD